MAKKEPAMTFEDSEPRPPHGANLTGLVREDLDLLSLQELEARIEALEAEIERSREAISRKTDRKSAAEALFSFGG